KPCPDKTGITVQSNRLDHAVLPALRNAATIVLLYRWSSAKAHITEQTKISTSVPIKENRG
ncbi:MAG: hypothetical protein WCG31_10835, partial [Deltaproteobacteria bacterium]